VILRWWLGGNKNSRGIFWSANSGPTSRARGPLIRNESTHHLRRPRSGGACKTFFSLRWRHAFTFNLAKSVSRTGQVKMYSGYDGALGRSSCDEQEFRET